jgi:hypothetical protein
MCYWFLGVMLVIGVMGWAWRLNLILNHPEKEARLREFEDRLKQGRQETFKAAAPVAGAGAKLLVRLLTKK